MSFYRRYVLPSLVHLAMRQKQLTPFRQRLIGAAEGRVLEIGIGSGLNLPLYQSTARSVIGLEPSPELLHMARGRAAGASVPVELLEASAETLPLDNASVDTVVTTRTLCTIPDAPRALAEMRRVLKPGGTLLFVEHGRAPEPGVARWQDRLDPLWSRIAGGCRLNRKIDELISGSGFRIASLQCARLPGPRTHSFLYEGREANMISTRTLLIIRWTTLGLIGLITFGIVFVTFDPEVSLRHQFRPVADNAPAGTVAGTGVLIGGPFNLVDHNGRPVTDAANQGRWVLVFFGYTDCADECPLTLQKMATALDALGPLADRIAPLFIIVDPVRDTPDRLASSLANFGSRIIGPTGSPEQIAAAAKAYRVYYSPAEHEKFGADLVGHSTFLYLINPSGKLDALFRPDSSADQLAAALRARLASQKQAARPG
ncbi:MAG: SCO family protein [Stellaceae bacterium]